MNTPLFSVVIPAYNRDGIISRAIDSVLLQTFTDFEIIVVDDGSTDDLKSVCEKYNTSKVKYIYQSKSGANQARNTGIKHSNGLYVSFLDSDDTWENEYLFEVCNKFSSDDELGLVYVNDRKIQLPEGISSVKNNIKLEGFIYKEVLNRGRLATGSCISVKHSLLEEIGGWDNQLEACQDDDICIRLSKITKVGYVNKVLCTVYIDKQISRISSSNVRRSHNNFLLLNKLIDEIIINCGYKVLENKIKQANILFLSARDKNGLEFCNDLLIKYCNFSKFKIFIFQVKCKTGYYSKYLIKKLLWKK